MTLACVDGGLLCGPLLIFLLGGLAAWLKCRTWGCDHHDH